MMLQLHPALSAKVSRPWLKVGAVGNYDSLFFSRFIFLRFCFSQTIQASRLKAKNENVTSPGRSRYFCESGLVVGS